MITTLCAETSELEARESEFKACLDTYITPNNQPSILGSKVKFDSSGPSGLCVQSYSNQDSVAKISDKEMNKTE